MLNPAVDCGAAGADATRVIGMAGWVAPRTGDGSRAPDERRRPRVAVGEGRREAREWGDNDWEWWCGLSGDGVRGEDRGVRSEELPVSAPRGGDDDSGIIAVGGVRAGDDGDDPGELILASLWWVVGTYIY